MKFQLSLCASLVTVASAATPRYNGGAFNSVIGRRQSSSSSSSLTVDLGYEQYMGVANSGTGVNTWKGYAIYSAAL